MARNKARTPWLRSKKRESIALPKKIAFLALPQHSQIEGVVSGAQIFSIGKHNSGTEYAELGLCPNVPKPLMGT